MSTVLTIIVALQAIALIGIQHRVDHLQDEAHTMTDLRVSAKKLFELTNKRLNALELAQQEQLDRIITLTASSAQNNGDLKRWTYKNINDIWYAIENPMTGKEDESEEVRS